MNKLPPVKLILKRHPTVKKDGYICLRVGLGNKKYKFKSTNIKIPVKSWNSKAERVVPSYIDSMGINKVIGNLKDDLGASFQKDWEKGVPFTSEHIGNRLNGTKFVGGSLIKFFAEYVQFISGKHSKGYVKHWQTELIRIKDFASDQLCFEDLSIEFLERYETWIREKVISKNTLHGIFKKLKHLFKRAIDRELIAPSQIAGYYWPSYRNPERHYLTLEQTETIGNLIYKGEFDADPKMLKIACFFLVECYSGIRFSDWGKFKIETLINDRNFKVRTTKNKQPIYLPLNVFTRLGRIVDFIAERKLVFDIPEQLTNRYLKYLATKAGIEFSISSHNARHTCATLLVGLGYSEYDIAEVLGISVGTVKTYTKMTRKRLETTFAQHGGL